MATSEVSVERQGSSATRWVCTTMGRRTSVCAVVLPVLLLLMSATGLVSVKAETSGGINASSSSVGLVPSSPKMGNSMDIRLTLENSNSFDALDVEYRFYKDGISSTSKFWENTVDIAAGQTVEVTGTWSALTEGDHKVWIEIEYGGDAPASFYKSFTVSGLANLEVASHSVSPESEIREGDNVEVNVEIENSGTVASTASVLFIGIEGYPSLDQYLQVNALDVLETSWINTSFIAPVSGDHTVVILPDVNGSVEEVVESGKEVRKTLTVDPEPDFLHAEALSVSTPENSIRGDWEVSGVLMRKHASGSNDVTLGFSFPEHTGSPIVIQPLTLTISGDTEEVSQPWNYNLTWEVIQNLGVGQHLLQVTIDPSSLLEQAITSNDVANVVIDVRPIPNVFVDEFANPSSTEVEAGQEVIWRVSILNTGDIPVSGGLSVEWEGSTTYYAVGEIDAGGSYIWVESLATSSIGAHQATFRATWQAAEGSYDSNEADSVAIGSVAALTELKMQFSTSTVELVGSNGLSATPPLDPGTYTLSVQLTSSGLGETVLICEDVTGGVSKTLNTQEVNISTRGQKVDHECIFDTEERSSVIINIRSSDSTVIQIPFNKGFNVNLAQGEGFDEGANTTGTVLLFGFAALILLGILVAAVILTRRVFGDVERDIYEYCPACEGEIEGYEDKCPHCDFNLKRARRKFHDCGECGENIPSLLENCPYCGSIQDLRAQFQARERKQMIALPEEEVQTAVDEEEDDDEIVAGAEDFDSMAEEFGYDEEGLESEWDESLEEAETEIDQMLERQAEIELWDQADDEVDDEGPVAAVPNISSPESMMTGIDLDKMLGDKGERRHLVDTGDDGKVLDASDAEIRGDLFEITGETGVLPGQDVVIGMGVQDHRLAGNELPEEAMDFSFEDDGLQPAIEKRRKISARRKERSESKQSEKSEAEQVGECGACGADIAVDAVECPTCGARFA